MTNHFEPVRESVKKTKGLKAQASKAAIVMAARNCFAAKGIFEASLDDIQKQANTSRGALYYHFKNKDEIIKTVIEENLGAMLKRIETIVLQSQEKHLTFENILIELTSFAEQITMGPGKGMAFHVWSYSMINEDIKNIMVIFFNQIQLLLEKEIKTLQKTGQLPKKIKAKLAATALFGLIIPGFTVQRCFMDSNSIDAKTYIRSIISLFDFENV